MEELDHALAAGIAALSLFQAFASAEALKDAPRSTFFKAGAITGVSLAAAVLLLWGLSGRALADFGLFEWAGPRPGWTAAAAAAWALLLAAAMRIGLTRFRAPLGRYYRSYAHLMPSRRGELAPAWGAGALAALGEEIAWRGFLIWYFEALVGLGPAILGSSILFGLAHGYQGRRGMAFAALAGLVLAGAYALSGSLLLAIWMHASYNMASFTAGWLLLAREPEPAPVA